MGPLKENEVERRRNSFGYVFDEVFVTEKDGGEEIDEVQRLSTDLTLILANGERCYCHRLVFITKSPGFVRNFIDWVRTGEMSLNQFPPSAVKETLYFLYHNRRSPEFRDDLAADVFDVAAYFKLTDLVKVGNVKAVSSV